MSTTTTRSRVTSFASDEDTTTTMSAGFDSSTFGGRTVEPYYRDKARPIAVRVTGSPQPLMWPKRYERDPEERVTSWYVLTLEIADNIRLALTDTPWHEHSSESLSTMLSFLLREHMRTTSEPKTPLGRRLLELRRRIIATGVPLLDWSDLDIEVRSRRGERE